MDNVLHPVFSLCKPYIMILASASPRRKSLLQELGLPFIVEPVTMAEPLPVEGELASDYAQRSALAKAEFCQRHLSSDRFHHSLVLAADTVVCVDGEVLGKPPSSSVALDMLRKLNGTTHQVYTGVYGCCSTRSFAFCQATDVTFSYWPDEILKNYSNTTEPLDKAGAYAIQGQGAFLAEKVNGSWSNVVGLPVNRLCHELLKNGFIESVSPIS